ncbi:MAG: hypothetical protein M3279_07815 [Actinomycetota bacterium]|nr:hypothetical protein [Actinomycetota bacterium]
MGWLREVALIMARTHPVFTAPVRRSRRDEIQPGATDEPARAKEEPRGAASR